MTLGSGGAEEAELRYKAFGDNRYTSGTTNTTFRFTGQREESDLGLYFYRSRWYDPYLNRWIQPDTIIPQPANPQSLNRFAYANNNPIRYTDPTGHFSAGNPPFPQPMPDLWHMVQMARDLAVGGGPQVAAAATAAVVLSAGAYCAATWAMQDMGPSYEVPLGYSLGEIGATYPIAGGTTVGIASVYLAQSGAVGGIADHLGFIFELGTAGLPGFPDPFNRHDRNKTRSAKNSAEHIRNSLRGIKRNLGRADLRSHLQETLTPDKYQGLTEGLDSLVWDLQNQGYFYENFGAELGDEILQLLTEMGYTLP